MSNLNSLESQKNDFFALNELLNEYNFDSPVSNPIDLDKIDLLSNVLEDDDILLDSDIMMEALNDPYEEIFDSYFDSVEEGEQSFLDDDMNPEENYYFSNILYE